MNKKLQILKYLTTDFLSSMIAWILLFKFRKQYVEKITEGYYIPLMEDKQFLLGAILIPIFWVIFYTLTGYYINIYRRSRIDDLWNTLWSSFIGVTFVFFTLLLDDKVNSYKDYYNTFFVLFTFHFSLTLITRLYWSTITNRRIQKKEIGFNTVIVGSNENAIKIFEDINTSKKVDGYFFMGFVTVNGESTIEMTKRLPHLGNYRELKNIINKNNIEEIIIAIEPSEHNKINQIVNVLEYQNVQIKIIPDMYTILLGMVRMNDILGAVLVEVDFEVMPYWQKSFKRVFDISFSILAITILLPIYIILAILVKSTSKGPIFYKQERIGYKGKPFNIIKYRTMYNDAEKYGPQLSKENDPRITRVGRFLRKTRLDEFPQFFNVLIGEMSIVGPRPERSFFIQQILTKAPYYTKLHKVKPGITSWGQVKYGYAENVDEMVQRLKYDLLYIENMSILLDIKILIYTALIMIQGRGK